MFLLHHKFHKMISEPACTMWELRTWISNYVFLALTHRYAVIELAKFRSRIFWPASLYELFRLNMTNPNQGSNAEITLQWWLLSIKCTHSTLYKLVSIEILYWCIWATFYQHPTNLSPQNVLIKMYTVTSNAQNELIKALYFRVKPK